MICAVQHWTWKRSVVNGKKQEINRSEFFDHESKNMYSVFQRCDAAGTQRGI